MSQIIAAENLALQDEIAALALRVARPLIWHDQTAAWPKILDGATCFFLQFEQSLIGVTADHVIGEYERALARNGNVICQLRNSPAFDLMSKLIDRDSVQDIATFRVSRDILSQIEAIPLDCRGAWPPPNPENSCLLSICGFPEGMRTITADRSATFMAWGALSVAESISDYEVLTTYDPARVLRARWAPILPPLGFNLSGCSGGPVLMHVIRNGLHRWFPIALVGRGPIMEEKKGALDDLDMIRLRRIHVIRADGTITNDTQTGWLPR